MLVSKHILMNEAAMDGAASGGQAATVAPQESVQPATTQPAATAQTAAPKEVKGVWADNWREVLSKGDEKRANIASRFASPEAVFDAFIQAQNKISSGNLKEVKPFPEKGTPEEQTAWRKDNGLPEAPDKYNLDGLVIGENDKPFVDNFLKEAHQLNMNDKQAAKAVDWYFRNREAQVQMQEEADRKTAQEVQEQLRQEWGGDYKANKTRIESLLDTFPQGIKEKLLDARYSDGTAIFNDPNILRAFAGLQMQLDPATTLVGSGGNQIDSIGDEISKIEKFMSTNRKDYFKDQGMQDRYRKLLDAREKLNRKAS